MMQGITEGVLVETMHGFLLNRHGEGHDRVRRLVARAFTARSVERFRPRIREIVAPHIERLTSGRRRS